MNKGESLIEFLQREWKLSPISAQLIEDNKIDLPLLRNCEHQELESLIALLPVGDGIRLKRGIERLRAAESIAIDIEPELQNELRDLLESGPSHQPSQPIVIAHGEKTPQQPKTPAEKDGSESKPITPRRSPRLQQLNTDKHKAGAKKKLFGSDQSPTLTITSHETLASFLKKDPKGNAALCSYQVKSTLTDKEKSVIANLIISQELSESKNLSITSSRFLELKKCLSRLLPEEDCDLWYTKYRKVQSVEQPARGRLLDVYYNIRKTLIRSNVVASKRKKSSTIEATASGVESDELKFVKTQQKPFQTLAKHWEATLEIRLKEFNDKNIPIHEYFDTYPVLKSPDGAKLLLMDFEKKFPNLVHTFHTNWPNFRTEFRGFVESDPNSYIKKTCDQLELNLSVKNDELADVHTLRLLAAILVKALPKLTKEDCAEGFISCVSSKADAVLKGEQRKAKLLAAGRRLQPLPIVVVDKTPAVVQSYVLINDVLLSVGSPSEAIDLCFKTCFLLNASYPPEAKVPWQFIQKYIYNHQTEFDFYSAEERRLYKNFLLFKANSIEAK